MPTSAPEPPSQPSSPRLPRLPALPSDARKLKVLDFDIENRPLSYWYDGQTTAEITAIAAGYTPDAIDCWTLGPHGGGYEDMLRSFLKAYNEADMVTGHFIRKHDLPIINGALLELGWAPLASKLTSDTKLDLVKRKDLAVSQEALAAMLGLPEPKRHMTQGDWREANRLTPVGIAKTKERVIGDVVQHMELRRRLLEIGALHPPKVWKP